MASGLIRVACWLLGAGLLAGCASEEKLPERAMESIEPAGIASLPKAVAIGDVVISGQPSPTQLSELKHLGFGTVINLRPDNEMTIPEGLLLQAMNLNYVNIPIAPGHLGDKEVKRFLEEVRGAHERKEKLFVHCSTGNRAAAMWAIYEITDLDVPTEVAVQRARLAGLTSAELIGTIGQYARSIGKY